MTIDVKDLLRELHEDHRNMALLLNLLEHDIDRLEAGDDPDFELLHDVMQYMTVYADAVHHPREDLVYARMRERGPDIAEGLEGIEEDHENIAVLGGKLRGDIEAIIAGSALTRDEILNDTRQYITRLRNHMEWEEGDLFERAEAMTRDAGDLSVDVSHLGLSDPVFGADKDSAFANLLDYVRRAAGGAA